MNSLRSKFEPTRVQVIGLTQGQFTIVDIEDYEWLNQWVWCAHFNRSSRAFYATRNVYENGKQIYLSMARAILDAKPGEIVDHVNRNTLDNRRANLRVVTSNQSNRNRRLLSVNNTSGYRGVYWHRHTQKWYAKTKVNSRDIYLGSYDSPEQAATAYDNAVRQYHEGFSPLNLYRHPPLVPVP